LLDKKNQDYSHDDDVHSNFKEMASICRAFKVDVTCPEGVMQYHVLHKIHRLFKLINESKEPANESIKDSVIDEQNYMTLLTTYCEENHNFRVAHNKVADMKFKRKDDEQT